MCIFRHDVVEETIVKNVVTAVQMDILHVDEEDETIEYENTNRTFNNPYQSDKPSSDDRFIYEICDFAW